MPTVGQVPPGIVCPRWASVLYMPTSCVPAPMDAFRSPTLTAIPERLLRSRITPEVLVEVEADAVIAD